MAVSLRVASSAWTELEADGSVAIPATPSAGDRVFLFTAWKDYSVTAAVSGWTEVIEWADGTTGSGNGLGSVKVACWYKDYTGAGDPTIDFSANPTNSASAMLVMQKGATEQFTTPGYVTAALSWGTGSTTTAASSTITVPSGGVVMAICGIRDDSATFTRGNSAIDDSATAVTWNGNYAEAPSTHYTDTTGDDLSADLGYRLVTTGTTGVTLRVTGTLSAAETGAALWIVQGVQVATSANATTATATGAAAADTAKVAAGGTGAGTATGAAQAAVGRPGTRAQPGYAAATGAGLAATAQGVDGATEFHAVTATATAAAIVAHGNISTSSGFATARSA